MTAPRGQRQLAIVQRARQAIGGLITPRDRAELDAVKRMAAHGEAQTALVFPGAWWIKATIDQDETDRTE